MQREVNEAQTRVLGAEHLTRCQPRVTWLALSLPKGSTRRPSGCSEVLGVQKRVLGTGHPDTLTAGNLALFLSVQGKHVQRLAGAAEAQGGALYVS